MKTRWLDRRIAAPGPYLALCLSDAEFRQVMAHLKAPNCPRWVNNGANATTHAFAHAKNGLCCVVCISDFKDRDPVEVAGMLVHEAVHVWQAYCGDIGEDRPGIEQQAYGVQAIAQELMTEFARRMA